MKLNTDLLIRGLRRINVGLSKTERREWSAKLRKQREEYGRRKVASGYMG